MYDLVKFFSVWVYPLGLGIVLLALAGLLLARGRRRAGLWLLPAGIAWIWFWSMPITAGWVMGALESDWDYRPAGDAPRADAIVVLGGAFNSGQGEWPYPDAGGGVDRYWHAARLFRAGKAPVIILSGGRNPARPESLSEAESGALLLGDLGVPADALIVESQARTTRDNVTLIGDIIDRRGIESFLLVTSARHMTRSVAAFRVEGLEPIAVPTDFTVVRNPAFSIRHYLPSASALARSSEAVHEIVGRWFYRAMGWA